MPSKLLNAAALVLSLAASGACVHARAASSEADAQAEQTVPPRMKPRYDALRIRNSTGRIYGFTVEVAVDEHGKPAGDQVRVNGSVPATQRQELVDWILRGEFEPATRGGIPVPGVFTMRF